MITVAAAQYLIQSALDWKTFTKKQTDLVLNAKWQGAKLLLLPEYAGIETVSSSPKNDLTLFTQIQVALQNYLEFYQQLAIDSEIYLQPGTIMVQSPNRRFYNRAYFFSPNGNYGYQDKLQLIASEAADQLIEPGTTQSLFDTGLGKIGIAICYDSEFPELVRNLTLQGAQLILVPSYTPSLKSFNRVFYSCRARAIENQCYMLMSSAIGNVHFGGEQETLSGQANLFSPIDDGFNEEGTISQGSMNKEEMIVGECDFAMLEAVRTKGQVRNFTDTQQLLENRYSLMRTQL